MGAPQPPAATLPPPRILLPSPAHHVPAPPPPNCLAPLKTFQEGWEGTGTQCAQGRRRWSRGADLGEGRSGEGSAGAGRGGARDGTHIEHPLGTGEVGAYAITQRRTTSYSKTKHPRPPLVWLHHSKVWSCTLLNQSSRNTSEEPAYLEF